MRLTITYTIILIFNALIVELAILLLNTCCVPVCMMLHRSDDCIPAAQNNYIIEFTIMNSWSCYKLTTCHIFTLLYSVPLMIIYMYLPKFIKRRTHFIWTLQVQGEGLDTKRYENTLVRERLILQLKSACFLSKYTHLKKESANAWRVLISNLAVVRWHNWHRRLWNFLVLYIMIPHFPPTINWPRLTPIYEMVQIQKLQMKNYHAG